MYWNDVIFLGVVAAWGCAAVFFLVMVLGSSTAR